MNRLVLSQITLKKERSISSTKWYYLLQPANATAPDSSNYGNPPPTYSETGYSGWSLTEPSYTIGDDRKLYQMSLIVYTDGTYEYSTPTLSSSYEASKAAYNEIIQAEATIQEFEELGLKKGYIWTNETYRAATESIPEYPIGAYIASGINGTITRRNSNTYGLNTWVSTGGIRLRYNAINLAEFNTSNLNFYYPSTSSQQNLAISLGEHNAVNSLVFNDFNGNKGMELTTSALTFYNPSTHNAQLTIGANGALQSGNYSRGTNAKFANDGTKIDLVNGDIITKYFRVSQGLESGLTAGAYIYGTIEALNGSIGTNSTNYWEIGNGTDYNLSETAKMIGHGSSYIQLGDSSTWRLATNRIHTGWYTSSDNLLHYPLIDSKYWDFGIHIPNSDSPSGRGSDKFLYIRSAKTNSTSLTNLLYDIDDNYSTAYWDYKFWIDKDGKVHAPGFYIGNSTTPIGGGAGTVAEKLTQGYGSNTQPIYVASDGTPTAITANVGNSTTPIYMNGGTLTALSYTIAKSVPSDALFTDHITSASTTGNGNAVTSVTSDANGNLTIKKDTTFLTSYTETDPTVPAWAKTTNKPSYSYDEITGTVPQSALPSYVDDVVEYSSKSSFPTTGESGKIYIDTSDNKTYRWSGTTYVEISSSLALGETDSTAYRGDRGKIAYDHAYAKGNAYTSGLYKITTNSEGHVTGATAVVKKDITDLGIPAQDTTYSFSANNPTLSWGAESTIGSAGGVTYKVTMPSNPNTDTKVTQTNTTGDADYRVLFSENANDNTQTVGARKSTKFKYNPSTGTVTATTFNGDLTGTASGNLTSDSSLSWSKITGTPTTLSGYGITDAKISNGVITLGGSTITPLTSHQDISGKADKSTAVTNVAYNSTSKKITKTINGNTTDVVTIATLKTDLALSKSDVGLGNVENKSSATIRGELTSSNVTTALGYTPYNSTNPNGYISVAGVVDVGPDNGNGKLRVYYDTELDGTTPDGTTGRYYKDVTVKITATTADTAAQADKLSTEGTVITNLSTTGTSAAKKYTEGGNIEPGVKGTLGVANGGTGATSFTANSLIVSGSTTTAALTTRAIASTIAASSTSTSIPTAAAVASFVEGKGYKTTDNNTTYTFANGTNKFTVTPSNGDAYDVIVTPSISNNITGTGTRTNGYLVKFSGTNTVTNGPALSSTGTGFLREDGTWATPGGTYSLPLAASGTRGGVQIGYTESGKNYAVKLSNEKMYVTVPWENTDTNYYHTSGSWNGLKYTATANGGAEELSFTIPTGTTSTTVLRGDHTYTTTIAKDTTTSTSSITLAYGTKYKLTTGGTSYIFTMPSADDTNTTYTFASGTTNGAFSVTPSGGSAQSVPIYGLKALAYKDSLSKSDVGLGNVDNTADANKNVLTATKFNSSRTISLSGDTTGSQSGDGSGGWAITTKTDRISTVGDNRAVATKPNDYVNKIIFQGLKNKTTIGSPSNDTYSYLVGLRGWSDSSGGDSHEIAFNNTGIYYRTGATTTWNAWNKIATTSDIPSVSNFLTWNTAEGVSAKKVFAQGTSFGTVTAKATYTEKANINYDADLDAIVFSFVS